MEVIILEYHYLFVGLTLFFLITLIGYVKANKGIKEIKTKSTNNNEMLEKAVSISDL